MARICLCCKSKQKELIERDILANKHSASVIAARHSVTKGSVLAHRRNHMAAAIDSMSQGAIELKQMLARADKLIRLLSVHLEEKPRDAVSLDWIRESRDLRGWMTYHSKHIGKLVPAGDAPRREGDTYNVVFVDPDGQQARIPLSVYRALPEVFKNGTESALESQSKAPQEVGTE